MINTIFYYVNTKQEYLQKLSQGEVSARTIVFIEETGEIYKNGKMFSNYKQLIDSIEGLREEILNKMEISKNSLRQLIDSLRQSLNDKFDQELLTISGELETYEEMLNRLRAELSNLQEDQGEAGQEINTIKAFVRTYATWKSATERTLTNIQTLLDAQNGIIETQGSLLDTIRNSVTNYEEKINLLEGRFQQFLEEYDITDKVKEIIGREISLREGLLHDFATITDVDDHFRNSVDEWFDALTPSWTQLTSRIEGLENRTTWMAGFDSRVEELEGKQTALTRQFSEWSDEYSEFLAALQTGASSSGSFFHLIADGTKSVNSVAAEIFGSVNADGSNITIRADRVFGLGDWILQELTVDKLVAGNAPNRIFIDSTRGIKHESENFIINIDGSGQIAGGKISWDVNGDITINGKIIGTGNINGLDSYFTNQMQVKIGDWGNGNLKDWIVQQLNGKVGSSQLDEAIDEIEATLNTYYIKRADINNYQVGVTESLRSELDAYGSRIADAESSINILNEGFTYGQDGKITGLSSRIDLTSTVTDYVNNLSGMAALRTWASTLGAGVSIEAQIRNLAGEVVRNASINIELTPEQLSSISVNADTIKLNSANVSIGDFVRAYGTHFSCWNFDLVNPPYYALRRYLLKNVGTLDQETGQYNISDENYTNACNMANTIYQNFLDSGNLCLDENFDVTASPKPKYVIPRDEVLRSNSAVLLDWSGITVLKDYLNKGDASLGYVQELFDTGDHCIQNPMYNNYYGNHKSSVPNIIPEKVNVNINASTGSGSLAWGNIRWSDEYQYTTIQDGNYQGHEIIDADDVNVRGVWYYTPKVVPNHTQENGVLIIKNAYLVNPKIVGGTSYNLSPSQNAITVPKIDVV